MPTIKNKSTRIVRATAYNIYYVFAPGQEYKDLDKKIVDAIKEDAKGYGDVFEVK